MTAISLRCSALPLALRCPGSVRGAAIDPVNDAATVGTAAHEALRALAETGRINWDSLDGIAAHYGVPEDELRMLCAMGAKLWPSVAPSFPDALTEVELAVEIAPGVTLTGHVDLLSVGDKVARAGDWKTGRKDSDYGQQMRGYGALVLLDNPRLEEVSVTTLWVRESDIENYTITRPQALAWARKLVATVVEWDGVFRPGSHCQYCPRSHGCEAANAMVRRDVAAIADIELVSRVETELALMEPSQIIEIHRKADLVLKYADRVRDAIKAHVAQHGDVEADGVRLTVESEGRREIDPLRAWPVLEASGFADEDFAACVNVSISKVEKRVAQKAGRGKGAGAVRVLQAQLSDAAAVSVKEIQKLRAKRA